MNRVREARLRAHMSQEELARKSGLARPTISKIERGETTPSGLSQQKIADALGVGVWELFPSNTPPTSHPMQMPKPSTLLGIAVVNGTMAAAGVRGASDQVAVHENRIEGFLVERNGERKANTLVHLIKNGEKIDSTVTGKQGRFVFKNVKDGEYVLLSEDKIQPVVVSTSSKKFDFDV